MPHFEIIGWTLPTLQAATEKSLPLLRRLAQESEAFCVESHFSDVNALKRFAEVVPCDRFACYCWSKMSDHYALQRAEFQSMCNARIVFSDMSIVSLEHGYSLPPYDWDGRPPESVVVRMVRRQPKSREEQGGEGAPSVARACTELAEDVLGVRLREPVKTVTEWRDSVRSHHYLIEVPRIKAALVAESLCAGFGLKNGIGSYELLGTASQLERTQKEKHFCLDAFPPECWNLNAPINAPFALARQGFLCPVLNVQAAQLVSASEVLDELGERVARRGIIRRYLTWKLAANAVSPQAGGNYCLISQQKKGFGIFLGFERYEDKDPSVREFTVVASPVVEEMGARLNKVSGPR